MRIIMLIDMDYFYVACEELRHPEISGRPAVVGADPKGGEGRGVVMTCNYKAREFGIRSGMPISRAYRIKPDAIFIPVDFDYYDSISRRIMDIIKEFAWKFEQVSVDEAFADVSERVKDYTEAEIYAKRIHDRILGDVGIKCSVGIGPSKLIAKMACEGAKPNGIRLVKEQDVKAFIQDMDVDDLYGIGGKTAERLKTLGYNTVGQLAKANPMQLIEKFGMFGVEMINSANGIDESEVVENYETKSISREFTFDKDTDSDQQVEKAIDRLSEEVIKEVQKGSVSFKTVTLKLRYADFTEHIHSKSIRVNNDFESLSGTARRLYKENVNRDKKVRKIGVRVSNLINSRGQRKIM